MDEQKNNQASEKALSAEDRIREAALTEFADKGFYGARTQAIAAAAGVNKAMVHYYFRSKEQLYNHVVSGVIRSILSNVAAVWLAQEPVKTRLGKVVDIYLDNMARNQGIVRIIQRELVDGGQRILRIFKDRDAKEIIGSPLNPEELFVVMGRDLGISPREALHFFINMIGMCIISFTSPPMLAALARVDITDFGVYLEERRAAIKAMLVASVDTLATSSDRSAS
jgi:AcrR family transcriptional regulator